MFSMKGSCRFLGGATRSVQVGCRSRDRPGDLFVLISFGRFFLCGWEYRLIMGLSSVCYPLSVLVSVLFLC